MIGAGAVVAAAAGRHAASVTHESGKTEAVARNIAKSANARRSKVKSLGPLFSAAADREFAKTGRQALRTAVESKRMVAKSLKIRHMGFLAGSALIGAGVHRVLADKEVDPKTNAAISTGTAAATHFAIRSSYLKGVGNSRMKAAAIAFNDVLKGLRKLKRA